MNIIFYILLKEFKIMKNIIFDIFHFNSYLFLFLNIIQN